MSKLDEIAINVELVLISLIEGVALVILAEHAAPLLHGTDTLMYVPYVLGGLAILLVFWAQSLLHAVSFIRWPIRIEHMFLYFLAGFVQIITYTNIEHMTRWFFWGTIFSIVALLMYALDLTMIRDARASFSKIINGDSFLEKVERRHLYEMKYLVPAALIFNAGACALALFQPELFESPLMFAIPGMLQLLISLVALYDCARNFRERSLSLAAIWKM